MSTLGLAGLALAYLALLFGVAHWADRRAEAGRSVIAHPTVYALSLAVYCTAWTYYGSVGRAAVSGIGFAPIFIGPTLVVALWWFVMVRMVRISKAYRITSIADFIASRYGKSPLLGGLVSIIAVLGVIPYIALQLKAVSNGFALFASYPAPPARGEAGWFADGTFYIALAMAAFTILFGTRHLDATERHEGMVAAVAFESVVKLLIFLGLGGYVCYGLFDGLGPLFAEAATHPELRALMRLEVGGNSASSWFALTVLAMLALFGLPRQFQVAVVENVNENHLRRAIWQFPLYLLLINLFVLPIALAGLMLLPGQDADSYVLLLPLASGQPWLAVLAFLGGLSAATSMVIVETIALSTMVCNDLVMPLLLRYGAGLLARQRDLSRWLLHIRRAAILLILLLGYLYFRLAGEAHALVSIGLISFAAVAQFAPAMLGGMYWRGATQPGALAGLLAGFGVWLYTLLLPSFARSGWLAPEFLNAWGVEWLRPQALWGGLGMDPLAHSLFWSLLCNIGAYLVVSLMRPPNAREAGQATLFVDVLKQSRPGGDAFWRGQARVRDLQPLLGRFLGPERAAYLLDEHARARGKAGREALEADGELVHFVETTLAGAIGSVSARALVASVAQEEPLGLDEVMSILDEASRIRAYSEQLEEKSRALIQAGAELRAANARLQELDRLKDDFMSSVTHELRTPLTSIRAFSELLQDDPAMAEEDRSRFLGIIVSETERLTRLVNQVLDLAKIESGRADWLSEQVAPRALLRQAAEALEQLFRDKGVILTLDLEDGVGEGGAGVDADAAELMWQGDPDRLLQVVINLLSNAVKFVPAGTGRVCLRLRGEGAGLRVEVDDNGPGLSALEQQVVFEKFRQGGNTLTGKPQGTGLGLPISRQIVAHHGGRMGVESVPGQGACFWFWLPAQNPTPVPGKGG
ncbi:MAG: sensor histidine kinase [Rhodocyclales bacterium]|nr:sensor histidine kinase [Rhodocyclales bacterium]